MTIAIASGKGGTGKTTVAVGLAEALAGHGDVGARRESTGGGVRLLDCDVEEPNDHLFLGAEETDSGPFSVKVPRIEEQKCTACGDCVDFCEFGALLQFGKKVMVFDNLCHGCGGCSLVCPENAISEVDRDVGKLVWGTAIGTLQHGGLDKNRSENLAGSENGTSGNGEIAFSRTSVEALRGELNVGEVLAPPLIREVKRLGGAAFHQDAHHQDFLQQVSNENDSARTMEIIIDSPPGTTCPMVTAVKDADFALLVTENTPFGLHDLEPAVETISEMEIPMGVVINRSDLGHAEVKEYCRSRNIPVMLEIPYDEKVAAGYAKGKSIVESAPEYGVRFRELYRHIEEVVDRQKTKSGKHGVTGEAE